MGLVELCCQNCQESYEVISIFLIPKHMLLEKIWHDLGKMPMPLSLLFFYTEYIYLVIVIVFVYAVISVFIFAMIEYPRISCVTLTL